MGTRRKPKAEVELIQALCNSDECTRLSQINIALMDTNTKLRQDNIKFADDIKNLQQIYDRTNSTLEAKIAVHDALKEDLDIMTRNQNALEASNKALKQLINDITSKWWYKLFS